MHLQVADAALATDAPSTIGLNAHSLALQSEPPEVSARHRANTAVNNMVHAKKASKLDMQADMAERDVCMGLMF